MKLKPIFILVIILIIPFISCEKLEFRKDISGTWKLSFAGGGYYPHAIKTNFTHLHLNRDYHYSIFSNDTLKASGDYSLYESGYDNNDYYEPFYIRFHKGSNYDSNLTFPIDEDLNISIIHSDTLIFSEMCCDGYQYFFTGTK